MTKMIPMASSQAGTFSLPVLQHIEAHFAQSAAGLSVPDQVQVHRRLENVLVEQVEADIRRAQLDLAVPAMPPELFAKHLAATFLVVVYWWLRRQPAPSAREAHDLFRALVEPTLRTNAALELLRTNS